MSAYSTLRRCGFGVAFCDPRFVLGVLSPLPGRQTFPRSELWVVLYVVQQCAHRACLHIVTDSQVTMRGVRQRWNSGDNTDMWSKLWRQVDAKSVRLQVSWVKSHLDVAPHTEDFPAHWVCGNSQTGLLRLRQSRRIRLTLHYSGTRCSHRSNYGWL